MSAYKTEDEQVEDIKRWWETNGKFVIILGIVVVASTVGFKTWSDFKLTKASNASAQYDVMMEELAAGKTDTVVQRGANIVKNNPELAYAVLSALTAAKIYVEKDDYDQAAAQLNWALSNATDEKMQHISRIRLAKVLNAQGKFSEALSQANHPQKGAFSSEYLMVKGDIYYKKGELGSAKTAYQAAIDNGNVSPQLKGFIQIKLDDIGGNDIAGTNTGENSKAKVGNAG